MALVPLVPAAPPAPPIPPLPPPTAPALPAAPALLVPPAPALPTPPPPWPAAFVPAVETLPPLPLAAPDVPPEADVPPEIDVSPPPPPGASDACVAQLMMKPKLTDTGSSTQAERNPIPTDYHRRETAPQKPWLNPDIYYSDSKPTARSESIPPTLGER